LSVSNPATRNARTWVGFLLAIGVVERGFLLATYGPVTYGDSSSYLRLADVIARAGLKGYDGTRVPGYPAFLALMGQNPQAIWLGQMVLGLATTVLIFFITYRITRNAGWAFAAGLLYDLVASQVLFEANLLSETLTTFFLMGALALFVAISPEQRMRSVLALSLCLGLAVSFVAMVRTLFYFLPVWLLPFIWLAAGGEWRRRLAATAVFGLAPLLILGGWVGWIYGHYGILSPSTIGGYNLVQHAGAYFEDLPDSEAVIRDTYIKYRDARLAEQGSATNAIWDAIPELSQKTGLSFFALSQKMGSLSIQLILTHPVRYARDVIEGWIIFWKAPVYWRPAAVHPAGLVPLLSIWSWAGRGLSLIVNAAFLLVTAGAVVGRRLRHWWKKGRLMVMMAGIIWISSIIQTLLVQGDNQRYLVPMQMMIFIMALSAAWQVTGRRRMERQVP
jgi:hypothetical protein